MSGERWSHYLDRNPLVTENMVWDVLDRVGSNMRPLHAVMEKVIHMSDEEIKEFISEFKDNQMAMDMFSCAPSITWNDCMELKKHVFDNYAYTVFPSRDRNTYWDTDPDIEHYYEHTDRIIHFEEKYLDLEKVKKDAQFDLIAINDIEEDELSRTVYENAKDIYLNKQAYLEDTGTPCLLDGVL